MASLPIECYPLDINYRCEVVIPTNIRASVTEDDLTFVEWANELGMNTPVKLFHYLCAAYRDGRVMVLDRPTHQALFEATRERSLREARRVARQEAKNVLFEMGYSPEK